MLTTKRMNKSKVNFFMLSFTIMVLLCLLSAPLASANQAPLLQPANATTTNKNLNIVVLGDSLAAGYQYGFDEKSVPYGFAEHVYEQALFNGYHANLQNYGVLGLTSTGLNKWLGAIEKQTAITPSSVQTGLKDPRMDTIIGDTSSIYNSIKKADLIVLAIGGNDFLSVLDKVDLTDDISALTNEKKQALLADLTKVISNYETELTAILQSITTINPNAKIAAQNHYLPLPTTTFGGKSSYFIVPFELAKLLEAEQEKLNHVFSSVVKTFQDKGTSIAVVDAASIISPNTLSLTGISQLDVHPNAKGYLEIGKGYGEVLFGQFKAVAPRKTTTPLSVVVNGDEVVSKYPTILKNGRTYLVLRDISDALGADLTWNNKTETATMNIDGHSVSIAIGANVIVVDGKQQTLKAEPAFLEKINGETKTYVPIAALSEGFGFHIVYRAQQKIAFIND